MQRQQGKPVYLRTESRLNLDEGFKSSEKPDQKSPVLTFVMCWPYWSENIDFIPH